CSPATTSVPLTCSRSWRVAKACQGTPRKRPAEAEFASASVRERTITMANDSNCIFCKIVRGEIPSRKVYEDDDILAFHDINPVAPVHFMLIPKQHVDSLAKVDERHQQVLGKMLLLAHRLATEQGSPDGFRAVVNTG